MPAGNPAFFTTPVHYNANRHRSLLADSSHDDDEDFLPLTDCDSPIHFDCEDINEPIFVENILNKWNDPTSSNGGCLFSGSFASPSNHKLTVKLVKPPSHDFCSLYVGSRTAWTREHVVCRVLGEGSGKAALLKVYHIPSANYNSWHGFIVDEFLTHEEINSLFDSSNKKSTDDDESLVLNISFPLFVSNEKLSIQRAPDAIFTDAEDLTLLTINDEPFFSDSASPTITPSSDDTYATAPDGFTVTCTPQSPFTPIREKLRDIAPGKSDQTPLRTRCRGHGDGVTGSFLSKSSHPSNASGSTTSDSAASNYGEDESFSVDAEELGPHANYDDTFTAGREPSLNNNDDSFSVEAAEIEPSISKCTVIPSTSSESTAIHIFVDNAAGESESQTTAYGHEDDLISTTALSGYSVPLTLGTLSGYEFGEMSKLQPRPQPVALQPLIVSPYRQEHKDFTASENCPADEPTTDDDDKKKVARRGIYAKFIKPVVSYVLKELIHYPPELPYASLQ